MTVVARVILESPYSGIVEVNLAYGRRCISDMLRRGEAPFASHLLYTQPGVLDDNDPEERKLGMDAGFRWIEVADYSAMYVDYGVSRGMIEGALRAQEHNKFVEVRRLDHETQLPTALVRLSCRLLRFDDSFADMFGQGAVSMGTVPPHR